MIELIVATASGGAIGLNNRLPWEHIPEDMAWFREQTRNKVVVMGSNTWFSLPEKFRPLPYRKNVVISSKDIDGPDLVLSGEPQAIVDMLLDAYPEKKIILIGGKKIYEDFFPFVSTVFLTTINQVVEHDAALDINAMLWRDRFHRTTATPRENILFEEWKK